MPSGLKKKKKISLVQVREVVWASYIHQLSSGERPFHKLCNMAWCTFKQAERDGTLND